MPNSAAVSRAFVPRARPASSNSNARLRRSMGTCALRRPPFAAAIACRSSVAAESIALLVIVVLLARVRAHEGSANYAATSRPAGARTYDGPHTDRGDDEEDCAIFRRSGSIHEPSL